MSAPYWMSVLLKGIRSILFLLFASYFGVLHASPAKPEMEDRTSSLSDLLDARIEGITYSFNDVWKLNQKTLRYVRGDMELFTDMKESANEFYNMPGISDVTVEPIQMHGTETFDYDTAIESASSNWIKIDSDYWVEASLFQSEDTPIAFNIFPGNSQEDITITISKEELVDWYHNGEFVYQFLRFNCTRSLNKCMVQFNHAEYFKVIDRFIELDLASNRAYVNHGFPFHVNQDSTGNSIKPRVLFVDTDTVLMHTAVFDEDSRHLFHVLNRDVKTPQLIHEVGDTALSNIYKFRPEKWSYYLKNANGFWGFREKGSRLFFRTKYSENDTVGFSQSRNILLTIEHNGSVVFRDISRIVNEEPQILNDMVFNTFHLFENHIAYKSGDAMLTFKKIDHPYTKENLEIPDAEGAFSITSLRSHLIVKYFDGKENKLGKVSYDDTQMKFIFSPIQILNLPEKLKPFIEYYLSVDRTTDEVWVSPLFLFYKYLDWSLVDLNQSSVEITSENMEEMVNFAASLEVKKHFATNADGVELSYTTVDDVSLDTRFEDHRPVLMELYGGRWGDQSIEAQDIAMWVKKGGRLVVADIQGAPRLGQHSWEETIGNNLNKRVDDIYLIAEDLFSKGLADPDSLALTGASNGALLSTLAGMLRPGFFKTVAPVSGVYDLENITDLQFYGEYWVDEYCDVAVNSRPVVSCPLNPFTIESANENPTNFLFVHSNNDGRVHVENSRKIFSFMEKSNIYTGNLSYFETYTGGHSFLNGMFLEDRILKASIYYGFLWKTLTTSQ